MATRLRQQSAAPSNATGRSNASLPEYEPPSFSLNPTAQRELAALIQKSNLRKLEEHLKEAQASVSNAAADVNDRLSEAEKASKKRKAKEVENGDQNEGAEDAEKSLEELRDKVDRMTQRMDESMRNLIDGQHGVQAMKESVDSTADFARVNASTQASTQGRTQTQRRRRRTEDGDGEDGEEDEDYADFEPTDPAANTQAQRSAIDNFRRDVENAKTRYQAHSLTARYAENNEYKQFRRVVHDARHHDGAVPLANPSEWFPEGERPAPGVTTRAAAAEADDDDDDDIAVSKASISTKCPLTLQEFKDPLSSTKCPHSFEREAILSMISGAAARPVEGKSRAEKAVQCPVSGCSKVLTRGDLETDKVLVRKIKRIQEAARLEEEENEDEDDGDGRGGATQRNATFIDDEGGDEDGADVDDIVEGRVRGTQVKSEVGGTGRTGTGRAGTGRVPQSQNGVVDLGGSSDEEEEAEEGEEDEEMEDS